MKVDVNVGDIIVLEQGKKGYRHIVGGRRGESSLGVTANPDHDGTDGPFIVNFLEVNRLDRREVELEIKLDELHKMVDIGGPCGRP